MTDELLKSLYDSLGCEADLRRLIAEKAKEDLHLEFKQKRDRSHARLEDSDAFQFSRALSGFANSDGGILVWGIETDKYDRAKALKAISEVQAFNAVLKKSLLNSTQPIVDRVQLAVIESTKKDGSGFVKCLIPSSEKAPHRAMLANREYFKRSTEGFYRLEHFDLEDMFGRRPHPSLTAHLELHPRPGDDPYEELHFAFINNGRGIAKCVGFVCRFDDGVVVMATNGGPWNATAANHGLPTVVYAENSSVIYPTGIVSFVGYATIRRPEKGQKLHIKLSWYRENMAMRSFDGEVPPEKAP